MGATTDIQGRSQTSYTASSVSSKVQKKRNIFHLEETVFFQFLPLKFGRNSKMR